jgi:hypothetical protein
MATPFHASPVLFTSPFWQLIDEMKMKVEAKEMTKWKDGGKTFSLPFFPLLPFFGTFSFFSFFLGLALNLIPQILRPHFFYISKSSNAIPST